MTKKKALAEVRALITQHQRIVENFLVRRAQSTRARSKVDRRLLVRAFVATGSYRQTATECGVGRERVRQLVHVAMRYLRSIRKAPALPELSGRQDGTEKDAAMTRVLRTGAGRTARAGNSEPTPELNMPTCIYCRATTSGNETVDHPIPQALGTGTYVLPHGAVCDSCNRYLGANLDQNFCDHHHLASLIVFRQARGSRGRTRIAITPDISFDPVSMHLDIRARRGEATFTDGGLVIHSSGSRSFDNWKFSRGLHRIALGVLARQDAPETALQEKFDPVRRYIRTANRGTFRPYLQRVAGDLASVLRIGIALAADAALVYMNFGVAEFVVALQGDVRILTAAKAHELSVRSTPAVAHLANREWLLFERATGQPRSLGHEGNS